MQINVCKISDDNNLSLIFTLTQLHNAYDLQFDKWKTELDARGQQVSIVHVMEEWVDLLEDAR